MSDEKNIQVIPLDPNETGDDGQDELTEDKTLNEYLQEAFNAPMRVKSPTGEIKTTAAELLAKQLVVALATGTLAFANGRRVDISINMFYDLVSLAFRQLSPPEKPPEPPTEIDELEQMSDDQIQRLYAELEEEGLAGGGMEIIDEDFD